MKWWINLVLMIFLLVIILPTVIVNLFTPHEKERQGKELPVKKAEEEIRINRLAQKEPVVVLFNHYEGRLMELPMEEYIVGVLAAEMPASFESEALKAQAVAARTLTMRKLREYGGSGCGRNPGADVCSDFGHCQAWIPDEEREKNWNESYRENNDRITAAVRETRGEIMTYQGSPIEVFYYSTSNGKTEDVREVFSASLPYYTVVDSPGEEDAPRYSGVVSYTAAQFVEIFKKKYPSAKLSSQNLKGQIRILSHTKGGRVKELTVGNIRIKGTDFRHLYGLNSADFSFGFEGDKIYIYTVGYGHGVGMSQVGANHMAKKGSSYIEILTHYYRGIVVENAY